jgi:hypothetical protein
LRGCPNTCSSSSNQESTAFHGTVTYPVVVGLRLGRSSIDVTDNGKA